MTIDRIREAEELMLAEEQQLTQMGDNVTKQGLLKALWNWAERIPFFQTLKYEDKVYLSFSSFIYIQLLCTHFKRIFLNLAENVDKVWLERAFDRRVLLPVDPADRGRDQAVGWHDHHQRRIIHLRGR